ncbi:hypothetical protein RHMOL_Rhmol06G0165600 [Rhododendron molle]|uniref:Uncharacterized protein n=1 Tax=Rhododendron molle TaxID=49168 RepID=A0ACC0ND60_RHOML|nr:hypothetical protein RHMOL_Rhmol06G0165600 [Rhododendron molle]
MFGITIEYMRENIKQRGMIAKNTGGSTSKIEKPRKKARRQLIVNEQRNAYTDEDDLPLAVAFRKKKKN